MTDVGYLPAEDSSLGEIREHQLAHDHQFDEGKPKKIGIFFWLCISYVVLQSLASVFANYLHLQNPNFLNYTNENKSPSLAHLFGTDENGRDIFARVIYGGRVSIEVGFGAMLIAFSVGGVLGMLAAHRRGKFDLGVSTFMYMVLAFPGTIFVIAILAFWQPRVWWKIVLILGVSSTPLVYRVIRASTLSVATRDFVVAAKVQGASTWRILLKELLPNVAPIGMSFLLLGIAAVIGVEGGLSFLGLSVDPTTTPTWGNLINESRQNLAVNPWLALFPSLAFFFFLLALNFAGDRLRSHFDITEIKL